MQESIHHKSSKQLPWKVKELYFIIQFHKIYATEH
jgi:hypothetical protein